MSPRQVIELTFLVPFVNLLAQLWWSPGHHVFICVFISPSMAQAHEAWVKCQMHIIVQIDPLNGPFQLHVHYDKALDSMPIRVVTI